MRSFQKASRSAPETRTPQSSDFSRSSTGPVSSTGSLAAITPVAIRTRQPLLISPER